MVTATSITREAPFLEDFRRRLLQGAFDLTKQAQPGTTPRDIAGLDVLQTGAMDQYARSKNGNAHGYRSAVSTLF